MGKAHGEVCGLFSLGRTPNWRRGTVWGRSTGDEVLWPDHNPPFPISLCPWGGGGRIGSEAEPGKKVGLVFIPHCLTPVLICNKLNYFFPSWVCFSHDSNWWAVFSVLISTQKLSLCIFFPCPEEAEWESSLMGSWCHPRLTHLTLLKDLHREVQEFRFSQAPNKIWHNCRPSARNSSVPNRSCWWHCP